MDPYGIKIKYMNADGQVFTGSNLVKQMCTMHASGSTGQILIYDVATTPGGEDTPKCKVDIVGTGIFTFTIPEPGALFENGMYIDLPSNVTVNVFYMDSRIGKVR